MGRGPGGAAARRHGLSEGVGSGTALPRRTDPGHRRRRHRGARRPRRPAARLLSGCAVTAVRSTLDVGGEQFAANREAMLRALAGLDAEHAKALAGGGEKAVARHRKRGKLLPRERIELLIDPDSPFLEFSPLAAWGSDFAVGASVVTGLGVIEDVECVLIANDPTVRGGASNPWTLKKTLRAMQIARENRLPL